MKHARTIARLQADMRALDRAAQRAGVALACAYATADEFEAAVIRARRGQGIAGSWYIGQMRVALAATAVAAVAMLVVIVVT